MTDTERKTKELCINTISAYYRTKRKELCDKKHEFSKLSEELFLIENSREKKEDVSLAEYNRLKQHYHDIEEEIKELEAYCSGMEMARELLLNL